VRAAAEALGLSCFDMGYVSERKDGRRVEFATP
jgi:hypothetical protein